MCDTLSEVVRRLEEVWETLIDWTGVMAALQVGIPYSKRKQQDLWKNALFSYASFLKRHTPQNTYSWNGIALDKYVL